MSTSESDNPHDPDCSEGVGLTTWTWKRGGTATVTLADGEQLTVHSSVAYPPGAPLLAEAKSGGTYELKVRSCRKLSSGSFEITGKLVNATRSVRERLVAATLRAGLKT